MSILSGLASEFELRCWCCVGVGGPIIFGPGAFPRRARAWTSEPHNNLQSSVDPNPSHA